MSKGLNHLQILRNNIGDNIAFSLFGNGELRQYTYNETYLNIIEKELKALEIIKREPSTVIEIITTYDSWKEYIKDYPMNDKTIWHIIKNKSEFDLLKEVLND